MSDPTQREIELQAELEVAQAFHRLAVAQRDGAWHEIDLLKNQLAHEAQKTPLMAQTGEVFVLVYWSESVDDNDILGVYSSLEEAQGQAVEHDSWKATAFTKWREVGGAWIASPGEDESYTVRKLTLGAKAKKPWAAS